MVASIAFQASPSLPTSSFPRGGASAASSPADERSAIWTSIRTRHAAFWSRYRVTRAHEGQQKEEAVLDGPEPVGAAVRGGVDVLLAFIHRRHVALDGGVQGRERRGIVAGHQLIECRHDLRAPEGLRSGCLLTSPNRVEPAVDLSAHIGDLAERASPLVARVPGQALREGQQLVGVAAVMSQDVRLGHRRVDLSQHSEVGGDEEDRAEHDGHAQQPEPCAPGSSATVSLSPCRPISSLTLETGAFVLLAAAAVAELRSRRSRARGPSFEGTPRASPRSWNGSNSIGVDTR